MKFRHKKYRSAIVTAKGKRAQFVGGELETTDRDIQQALKRSPNVERVDEPKKDEE